MLKKTIFATMLGAFIFTACEPEEAVPAAQNEINEEQNSVQKTSNPVTDLGSNNYYLRLNGTATGHMTVGNPGTLQAGSSGNDVTSNFVAIESYTYSKYKMTFDRTGSYNHSFVTWVSGDGSQITGYYELLGQELPIIASTTNRSTVSGSFSTIDGTWDFLGNGTSVAELTLNGSNGSYEWTSNQDPISNLTQTSTGWIGASKIVFSRGGQYPGTYYGWVSYDNKTISGYYVLNNGETFPWTAYRVN